MLSHRTKVLHLTVLAYGFSGRKVSLMTEQEWLECNVPKPMWQYLESLDRTATIRRKTKLLACGMVRLAWHLLDEQGKRVVESMER